MKKTQVIEIGQVRTEQFFRHKFQLVERLNTEILSSYSFGEYQTLKKQFDRRVKEPTSESFLDHWLLFYYQDEKGKRGIERYNELFGKRDEQVLRELATGWERLVPRLIQQVDYDERGVVVEDLFTKERFHMPYCETMKEWVPWAGTFCLLEEFENGYYINGIAVSVGPTDVKQAFDLLNNHLKEIESTYDQAARELYPEMLGALLSKRKVEEETREIIHTELHYDVQNMVDVLEQCRKDDHFRINEWNGSHGQGQFFKKMYRYEDNAAKGPIHLAEEEGHVEIENGKLTYISLYAEGVAAFKQLMNGMSGVELHEDKTTTIDMPAGIQTMMYSVHLPEGVPSEFAMVAQSGLLLEDLDQPLPLFENQSPEEMMVLGKMDELEQWIREQEFGSYMIMKKESGEVKVTADFNTVRRRLGLKLSPFVTLGEKRQSMIMDVMNTASALTKEDLLLVEEIGIPLHEAGDFYSRDVIEFFREKAVGKSANTYYKYRIGLQTMSYFFNRKTVSSWSELTEKDWLELIAYDYLAFNLDASDNQVKGFFTTVKGFTTWIDKQYGTGHAPFVRKLVKEMEPHMMAAIFVLDTYVPYYERKYRPELGTSLLHKAILNNTVENHKMEGVFQVRSITGKGARLEVLGHSGENYEVAVPLGVKVAFEPGMLIVGSLLNEKGWKILGVERVFPAEAVMVLNRVPDPSSAKV